MLQQTAGHVGVSGFTAPTAPPLLNLVVRRKLIRETSFPQRAKSARGRSPSTMPIVRCFQCNVENEPEREGWWYCVKCGSRLPPASEPSAVAGRGRQQKSVTQHDGLAHCLLCQERTVTEICFVRLISVKLVSGTKITQWIDVRCRCCQRCCRKIKFSNRTEGIRTWLNVLLMSGLFVGYVCLIPWLLHVGVPGVVVGFGGLVAPLIAVSLWRLMASHRWRHLLAPQTIELFKAAGIEWDASMMSGLSITSEPVPGSSYVNVA